MKKRIKNIISAVLVFCMVISISVVAFAKTNNDQLNKKIKFEVTANEYDMIKKIKNTPVSVLKEEGFSDQEINAIKDFDYKSEIFKLKKLDEDTLKGRGYTDKQINILKSFQGTEEEMQALAATLTINGILEKWAVVDGQQKFEATYYWMWSSVPISRFEDIIAFGWNQDFNLDTANSYSIVNYVNASTGQLSYSRTYDFTMDGTNTASHKFNVEIVNDQAMYGNGRMSLYRTGALENGAIVIKYGHRTVIGSPSVSLGGLSLSFNYGTSTAGTAYVPYPEAN
jgi:hypothetical protein